MHAAFAADAVDGDDVRMFQRCCRARFVLKPLQMPRVHGSRERQSLKRYAPAQRDLFGFVDDPHPAAADFAKDAEVAECLGFVFFTQCRSSRVTFRNGVRKMAEYTQCRNQLPKLL